MNVSKIQSALRAAGDALLAAYKETGGDDSGGSGPAGPAPSATVPKMQPYDFYGAPLHDAAGVVTEDFWMDDKTGAQRGAIYNHWVIYNQITGMMARGKYAELEVVCAPPPGVDGTKAGYNAYVHNVWEIGWTAAPPFDPNADTKSAEVQAQWAAWEEQFKGQKV